ncbi:hypothetical protein ACFL6U_31805 [Planctomycetota bacterium]
MKAVFTCVLVGLLALITGCASPTSSSSFVRAGYDFSNQELVAIVDVVGEIYSERAKNQIADLFTMQFLAKGFAPIQREHVLRRLNENGFDRGDLSPEAYAIEAGRVLHVPAVLIVTIPSMGSENSLTAKIMEVENGTALWLGSGSKTGSDSAWYSVKRDPFEEQFGGGIFEQQGMSARSQQEAVEAEPVEIALTPQEVKRFNTIVRDICRTIPSRAAGAKPSSNIHWPW